jgi:choline monooxygenase
MMRPEALFDPGLYVETRRPIHQASTLPPWCYVSSDWYERELETIFRREWLCVGRAEQVPEPGDYLTIELIGEPLIVVRDDERAVRAFSAVCRHRAAVVVQGSGTCRAFQCPYHNWTYSLKGELLGTPGRPRPMDDVENFDHTDYGLLPIRLETWRGFLFVTFDPTAEPVESWLGDLPELLERYDIAAMRFTHQGIYDVACNWKVYLENAFEAYHAATVHRKHVDPATPLIWTFEKPRGPYEAMYSRRSIVAYQGLPPVDGLSEKEREGMYHVWVHPSLQLIMTPTYMKYRLYLPQGPQQLRLVENWTFPRATVAREDFGSVVGPTYYAKYEEIIHEDMVISPIVQQGQRSRLARPGRYSPQEHIVHRIANYVLDRVVGEAP